MKPRFRILTCLVVAACGCRGCDDRNKPAASAVERSEQSERARVLSRMSARKLDRNKVYPKDAQGVVQCDNDMDCFILQAEHCTPASLRHLQTVSGYGLQQRVQARYRVAGTEAERCKIDREVVALEATLSPVTIEALKKSGKTDDDIETMRSEALETLRRRNPARLECFLTPDQALEASLNLAEGRYNPLHWRDSCREVPGPPPRVGIDEATAQAKDPDAAAAKDAPAKADVPVPKQP